MNKTALILAEGFEEVEALTVVDLLRRADIVCDMVSLRGTEEVTGSHGITVRADKAFGGADFSAYDGIILPGGMPGTKHLAESAELEVLLKEFHADGKLTAAICAAPSVLAKAGLLAGKTAVSYPSWEEKLTGAVIGEGPVARDGSVVTSRGVGTAIPFALALVEYYLGSERAAELADSIVFPREN